MVLRKSVAHYFDSDGHLVAEALKADFRELLEQLEEQCGAAAARKAE